MAASPMIEVSRVRTVKLSHPQQDGVQFCISYRIHDVVDLNCVANNSAAGAGANGNGTCTRDLRWSIDLA